MFLLQKKQPPTWTWTSEAENYLHSIVSIAKKNLVKQNRAISQENKAQPDGAKHKPLNNIKEVLHETTYKEVHIFNK